MAATARPSMWRSMHWRRNCLVLGVVASCGRTAARMSGDASPEPAPPDALTCDIPAPIEGWRAEVLPFPASSVEAVAGEDGLHTLLIDDTRVLSYSTLREGTWSSPEFLAEHAGPGKRAAIELAADGSPCIAHIDGDFASVL